MLSAPCRSVRRGLRRAGAVVALAVAATGLAGVAPAHAAETPTTFFTMLGGGDWVGGTSNQLFHPGNATVTVSGSASLLNVSVNGGTLGTSFTLHMAAPSGQTLVPGTYEGATRYPFQASKDPGLTVSGDGRGCNTSTGRFVVYDMAVGENGVINRFSATYQQNCEGGPKSLIGQISVNQPRESALLVAGDVVDWPELHVGMSRTVPVWVHNRGTEAVTVTGAALGGVGAGKFAVTSNTCSSLAPGATCVVYVRYQPSTRGASDAATLTLTTAAASYAVALNGRSTPGYTALYMRSEAGDYIGGGGKYAYTPANATMSIRGSTGGVTLGVDSGSSWWTVQLEPATGDVLTPGTTYTGATRAAFTSGVGMDVSGSGRGCNTLTGQFTVIEATYKDGTGPVETFSATFEQHCEGGGPALHGWVSWQATQPNVPPPGPLAAPSDLKAYPDVASVVLTWANPEGTTTNTVRGAYGLTAPGSPTAGWAAAPDGLRTGVYVAYLTPGASYSFSVFAKDAAGNLSPAAKITLRGSAVTLRPSAAAVTYGAPMTLTTKLVDAASGTGRAYQEVDLYARKKGAREYFWVDTLKTNSSGVATFTVNPAQSYEFQVIYAGLGRSLGVVAGPVLVAVRTRVSAALSRTSVARYGAVTVSGSVAPGKAGKTVYLQRYVSGAWRTLTSKALSTTSSYAFTIKPSTAGTWQLRVYRPADATHAAGASPTRTLTVT